VTAGLRVAVVEDHPVFRDGLGVVVEAMGDAEMVGSVGTVREALELLESCPVDVLLLDLGLPDGNGLDILSTLRARHADVAVVVLTMSDERQLVLEAVRAGARGYLLKGSGRAEIAEAVRRAAGGGAVFDAVPAQVLMAAVSDAPDPLARYGLTPRESDVLRLVAEGLGNQAIAVRLGVSGKTVRNQVSVVLAKLGVDSRTEAAAKLRTLTG
jgi:DNA-binding NarL/FixJ family response regulator